jgi:16S rRNA U516 pseudouridylate synthase RsuA-like enzyme
VIKQAERYSIVEIKIFEGKTAGEKNVCRCGNKVLDLERVAIGELHLGH